MPRRIYVRALRAGEPIPLDPAQTHHVRDVLRLAHGSRVEVFDDAGLVGEGFVVVDGKELSVRVEQALWSTATPAVELTIAAAIPKGERADWMVEKLSELGVAELVPLAAARSVVLPEGKSKRDRWNRIATEAAKQSRRAGVMRIAALMDLATALRQSGKAWFASTELPDAMPIASAAAKLPDATALTAFIGPEGGWTEAEQAQFVAAGATPVRLTATILRIETAAVATAAVVACLAQQRARSRDA